MTVYLVQMINLIDQNGQHRSDRYLGVFDSEEKAQEVIRSYLNNERIQFNYVVTKFELNRPTSV